MENPVLIIGAGNIGQCALDIFVTNDVVVYGLLDENNERHNEEIGGVLILGDISDSQYLSLVKDQCEYFIASDNSIERRSLAKKIEEQYLKKAVNAIHSTSSISSETVMGHGNLVGAGCILAPGAAIGDYCNLEAGAIIDISTTIGNGSQIGINSSIASDVTVGENVFIGPGVTVVSGITIGDHARIGAGSVVIGDVAKNETVFGNPAKSV